MPFPPFTDLGALASGLKKNGKHSVLHQSLLQAWRAESCLSDLLQAQDCCDVLQLQLKERRYENEMESHTVERSLLTTAVLLYARGTSTSGKAGERGSIKIERGQLSKEQWQDHQNLVELRNNGIAHVNPDYSVDSRSWHKVRLFAVQYPAEAWRPAASTNETGYHKETHERLVRMLPVANEIELKQFKKRMAAVERQINEANLEYWMLNEHIFDPAAVFGGDEAVRRLLEGSSKSTDRFWVDD